MPERDFDKEMAEVDRLLSKLPSHPDEPVRRGGAGAASKGQAGAGPGAAAGKRLGAWLRVGLGVALAAGMTQWPYAHPCGWSLAWYLLAVGTVVVWGVWGLFLSWRHRLAIAHVLSLATLLTGLALGAVAALERSAYAKAPAAWFCP